MSDEFSFDAVRDDIFCGDFFNEFLARNFFSCKAKAYRYQYNVIKCTVLY